MRITAPDLLELGVVDEIIPEPPGGAHTDPETTCRAGRRRARQAALAELVSVSARNELVARRYQQFRALGVYDEG